MMIIIDDPQYPDYKPTEAGLAKAAKWFDTTVASRVTNVSIPALIIFSKLHHANNRKD